MPSSDSSRDVALEQLAQEFVERYRRGECPPLTEYTDRRPDLAQDIRELFPALVQIEHLKPAAGDLTGPDLDPSAPPPAPHPERLGDYRILREIGRGGTGVVYEAEQESLGRHVALKVLPPNPLLNRTYLERFRREAKAAAKLHHTNIVPVFGVGEEDGVPFYAMQFIRGEGLDRVLHDLRRLRHPQGAPAGLVPSEGSLAHSLLTGQLATPATQAGTVEGCPDVAAPVPNAEPPGSSALSGRGSDAEYYRSVARIGLQIADALAYAHRQGVLHRDIKPSNLLLDAQGTVWITDFGLAKAEGTEELTQTGDIVGTLRFMAPERFDGRSLPQSDVYSLSLTVYELLALRPAFDDTNKGRLIDKVLHDPPSPPRKIDPRIPRDLETVVLKGLAKDPAERYPTAEALAEDLRRFLADRPVKARRASSAERLWRWARRNPAVASLLGCVAGLLIAVAVVSTFSAVRMNAALVKTKEAEREARLREAEALVGQAHGIRYSRRVGQRFEALAALDKAAAIGRELGQPPEWFDRLRNEAIGCLALPDLRTLREWDGFPPGTQSWDCDDRHRLYARIDRHGHISVRRLDTDVESAQLDGFPDAVWLRFSPDGRFLMCAEGQQVRVWDLAGSPPGLVVDEKSGALHHAFDRDSRRLILTRIDGSIQVYDLLSPHQAPQPLAKFGDGPVSQPTFDPHGDKLAVVASDYRTVHILDARSGKPLSAPWRPKAPIFSLAWHPAGKLLAAACQDRRIRVWDTVRGQEAAALEGWRGDFINIAFTPEGEFVVSQGWEGKLRFWHWRTGQQVLSCSNVGSNFRFGPDGRLIIGEGNRLKLVKVAGGREYRTLVQQSSPGKNVDYESGAVHPDGRLLAVAMNDAARLWDLETGDEVACIGPNPVWGVAFTSDALLTNGPTGLFLWPIRHDANPGSPWQIGPPRLLNRGTTTGISCSSDGQLIAQPISNGAVVLHRDHPERPTWLGPQQDVRGAFISPDGRLAATVTHLGGVKIWETEHRQLVKELPSARDPAFSPDGKRLAVPATQGSCILTVGNWEEGPALPLGFMAFSPDGNLLAVGTDTGVIHLLDPATGREKALLEDPHQDRGKPQFTPDSTRLVVVSEDGRAIHVWDLKRISAELGKLDLDWDAPSYPERADPAPGSLEVQVVGADLPAKLQEATEWNDQAWGLVTGPEGQRNPARALELIQKAIERDLDNSLYLNTLGVAQYRNGQYAAAVVTLEKSLAASKGQSDGFDLFFLAMCHAQLGEPAKAKDCFDRAVTWTEAQKDLQPEWVKELKAFRAEAEAELRVR